jgi:hypothetical protein
MLHIFIKVYFLVLLLRVIQRLYLLCRQSTIVTAEVVELAVEDFGII